MADYYTVQQLAQVVGIAEVTLAELQTKGLLQPTVKDGRSFFHLAKRTAYVPRLGVRAKTK
jgi:hypothetical protein